VGLGAGISAAFGGTIASGAAAGWGLTTVGMAAVGAAGAAAGSIASQAIGVTTGIQDKFSWKGVALAGLSGGIGGGLGNIIKGAGFLAGAERGALGSALSQGVGVATGLQDKFSWAGVAAAGISSGVGAALGGALKPLAGTGSSQSIGNILSHAAVGAASSIAYAATRSAIEGSNFGDSLMSGLPEVVGETIGNLVAGTIAANDGVTALAPVTNDGNGQPNDGVNCFPAGTMVHTRSGLRPIETVEVGDWVAARPEANPQAEFVWRRVVRTYRNADVPLVSLSIQHPNGESETISTTPEHLFFVNGGDWRKAGELCPGDQFERLDGGRSTLIALGSAPGLHTVYNFTVDQDHTYFVGTGGIWVHNHYGFFGFLHRADEFLTHGLRALGDVITGHPAAAHQQWTDAKHAFAPEVKAAQAALAEVETIVVNGYRRATSNENVGWLVTHALGYAVAGDSGGRLADRYVSPAFNRGVGTAIKSDLSATVHMAIGVNDLVHGNVFSPDAQGVVNGAASLGQLVARSGGDPTRLGMEIGSGMAVQASNWAGSYARADATGRQEMAGQVFGHVVVAVGTTAATGGVGEIGLGGRMAAEGVDVIAAESVPLTSGSKLLPGEGMVGTYDDLIAAGTKGDNITPHHIPSANRMALEAVSKGDGIAINMEQPFPGVGGRHRATFTYGTTADIDMTARDALAAGVWDARQIYRADGLYTPQIRSSLQDLIRMNKANHPTVFVK
jgi:hypothetical protein